jgi:hypothetical protein
MNSKLDQQSLRTAWPAQDELVSAQIERERNLLGLSYGLLAGLTFAIALFGWDALELSQANSLYPWMKLISAIVICSLIGGLAGWFATRKESGCASLGAWVVASICFAWTSVGIPTQVFPLLARTLDPQLTDLLHYEIGAGVSTRFGIALAWIVIFTAITGVLQSPLIDSATGAISFFGRATPGLVCILLMFIGGKITDDVINRSMREAIYAVDTPIQFILDHRGMDIDPAESRLAHAGAFRGVLDEITVERKSIISSYDQDFGQINVFIRFEDAWVDCATMYGQASYCELATTGS